MSAWFSRERDFMKSLSKQICSKRGAVSSHRNTNSLSIKFSSKSNKDIIQKINKDRIKLVYNIFHRLNQNFTRQSWMTIYPEMLIKKRINFLCFFSLNKCSLNLVLRARLVCPTYCIPQPSSLQVRTFTTISDFQSKSELFTTENCLRLTKE